MNRKRIVAYYEALAGFYRRLWYRNSGSYALHYGLWDNDTRTLGEALLNTNAFLARRARIRAEDIVLDAGTGIGGSALWIAKHLGARVFGITLSAQQVRTAQVLAQQQGLTHRVTYSIQDYTHTDFPDAYFDVVWAVESVCHAERKADFLREAWRILKSGGVLIVADGFLHRPAKTGREQQTLREFLTGLALPGLDLVENFRESLEHIGFARITFWDKTSSVLPSSRRLFWLGRIAYPLSVLAERAGFPCSAVTQHSRAAIRQYQLVRCGLAGYGVFRAEKV